MGKQQITFPNGNTAWVVTPAKNAGYPEIREALGIQQPKALLMISGGAANMDESAKKALALLFSDGIASIAAEMEAMIIDGATQAGVVELVGLGVAEQGRQSELLGVAPDGKVTYPGQPTNGTGQSKTALDPNHSHFVLVKGNKFGDETTAMYGLAAELRQNAPVMTLLVNGGDISKQEVLQSVRRGWPVVVITGSGGLADELAERWREKSARPSFIQRVLQRPKEALPIKDPDIVEIIDTGDISLFPSDGRVEDLRVLLKRPAFKQQRRVLAQTEERRAYIALMARQHQKAFKELQRWIALLGLLAIVLALGQIQLEMLGWLKPGTFFWDGVYHFFVVLVPIIVSALLAIAAYFTWGNKWVLLRAAAEALKQEMYRYRMRTGIYTGQSTAQDGSNRSLPPDAQLAEKAKMITQRLMQTEVNIAAPTSSHAPGAPKARGAQADDGLSDLTPDLYIKFRLEDQLSYYRREIIRLNRQLKLFQSGAIIFSGLGALLAAFVTLWVPLATAIAAAITLYLQYMQVANTLTKYNQSVTDLENIKQWWTALPAAGQEKNRSLLVDSTEGILGSEQDGWSQRMHDALEKLYKKEAQEAGSNDSNANQ